MGQGCGLRMRSRRCESGWVSACDWPSGVHQARKSRNSTGHCRGCWALQTKGIRRNQERNADELGNGARRQRSASVAACSPSAARPAGTPAARGRTHPPPPAAAFAPACCSPTSTWGCWGAQGGAGAAREGQEGGRALAWMWNEGRKRRSLRRYRMPVVASAASTCGGSLSAAVCRSSLPRFPVRTHVYRLYRKPYVCAVCTVCSAVRCAHVTRKVRAGMPRHTMITPTMPIGTHRRACSPAGHAPVKS